MQIHDIGYALVYCSMLGVINIINNTTVFLIILSKETLREDSRLKVAPVLTKILEKYMGSSFASSSLVLISTVRQIADQLASVIIEKTSTASILKPYAITV